MGGTFGHNGGQFSTQKPRKFGVFLGFPVSSGRPARGCSVSSDGNVGRTKYCVNRFTKRPKMATPFCEKGSEIRILFDV
jgi:hypothetical protein